MKTHCNLVHLAARRSYQFVSHEICRATRVRAIWRPRLERIRIPCRGLAAARSWPPPPRCSRRPRSAPCRPAGEVDVVIVGAGAAGIAAARRVAAAKQRFALIEAGDRVGGRCVTDTQDFRRAVRSRRALDPQSRRQSVEQARGAGRLDIYPAPRGQTVRIGPRKARDGELENFLSRAGALASRHRRRRPRQDRYGGGGAAARSRRLAAHDRIRSRALWLRQGSQGRLGHRSCPRGRARRRCVLPAGLWRAARQARRRPAGAAGDAGHAHRVGQRASRSTPPQRPRLRARRDRDGVDQCAGQRQDRIQAGAGPSASSMPRPSSRSAASITSRSTCRAIRSACNATTWCSNKSTGARTAALLANVSGTSLHLVEVAGRFRPRAVRQGEAAMVDFAGDWLASLFGSDVKRAIKRSHATRWNDEPWVLGAMSAAAPGSADARRILMEPLGGRIWFAGEAVHETQWGTVAGAWESGTRAAEAALRQIGALKAPDEDRAGAPLRANAAAAAGGVRTTDGNATPESADRLVERQGQRLGAARGAPRRRIRHRRRLDHGDRQLRPRQHAWRARGIAARAARGRRPAGDRRAHSLSVSERNLRARDGGGDAGRQGARRHAYYFRRSLSGGRARLSREKSRRHRHHAGVSLVAAADRAAGARHDRRPASRRISLSST